MTREEAERKITEHLEAISEIVKEYGGPGYLGMSIEAKRAIPTRTTDTGEEDKEIPLRLSKIEGKLLF